MNKLVILLYQPLTHGRTSFPPLGLAYLSTYIQKNTDLDVEVIFVDNDEKKFSTEHLKRFLLKTNPVLIGVTVNILNPLQILPKKKSKSCIKRSSGCTKKVQELESKKW